ncbi:MAG: DUF2103 domain-containing protein [bacterium]
MPKKGLFGGHKIGDSHSTVIPEVVLLIEALKEIQEVKKIIIGVITPIHVGHRRIKCVSIPAGMRLTVRGVNATQKLFIYTVFFEIVEKHIICIWHEKIAKLC